MISLLCVCVCVCVRARASFSLCVLPSLFCTRLGQLAFHAIFFSAICGFSFFLGNKINSKDLECEE